LAGFNLLGMGRAFLPPSACQSDITIIRCPTVSCLQRIVSDVGLSMSKLLSKLLSVVRLSPVVVEARDDEDRLPE
jgi:hypothetical protein